MNINVINYNYLQQRNEKIHKTLDFRKLNHIILNILRSLLVTMQEELLGSERMTNV
jgi:hypothetical protein